MPHCPYAASCGACGLMQLPYAAQLQWKQAQVEKLLAPFCRPAPILGMEQPQHYRCKVQAAFTKGKNGRIVSGPYRRGTHQVVPAASCLVEDQAAAPVFATLRRLLASFRLEPYDEDRRRGFLRYALLRRGHATGQLLLALVAGSSYFPKKAFVAALRQAHPELTTIVLDLNTRSDSLVLSGKEQTLYGPGYIEDELCGSRFRLSANSFFQVNPAQCERLYQTALDFADLHAGERILDAYCGVGTMTLAAAKRAGQALGVEQNPAAVRDAVANAKRNRVRNARFVRADAAAYMEALAQAGEHLDAVIFDPPRAGASEVFLRALCRCAPRRAVYVSCSPETQARDLRLLCANGWQVTRLQPVDMFPYTEHVECVALMSRMVK